MKCRFAILLVALSLAISQMALGADSKGKTSTMASVSRLPFDKAAPLPGALVLSADGRIAAHIGANGDIVIWDASQVKPLEIIPAGDMKPSALALSTDGNLVAIGYFDSRLIVRSRLEKKPLREYYGHSGGISALAFSPDEQMLASGGDDATTQLWEVNSGRRLQVFDSMSNGDISTGSGIPVSIGFSGNGKVLFVNEWYSRHFDVGRSITLWDIQDGIEISTRDVAPPNSDNAMRAGQSLGGNGWLLAYTGGWLSGKTGLMIERLDQCESPRQLPFGGYADTVAADPQGRWVAAAEDGKVTFSGINNDKNDYAIALPAKALALVPHPDGWSVLAVMISDTQSNGNERFVFGRDAETVTGASLYRIEVPEPLWHLPPLIVKQNSTHCSPTAATRAVQDFRIPGKPEELAVTARLVPTREMVNAADNVSRVEKTQKINPPMELYFAQDGSLYALYHQNEGSDLSSGVAVWNTQTQRLLRSRFGQRIDYRTVRLREGWGATGNILTNLLTGTRLSSVSNDDDKSSYLIVITDPDTGQFFRRTDKFIERYDADGRRLSNVKTKKNVAAYAVRNGRLAALYGDGNVQVWQLEPSGESKTYKLDLKLSEGEWADDLALSADGHYLRIAFPNASGDGPTGYATYRLSSAKLVGGGQLLAPFPGRANRGVVADTRSHRLAVWDFDRAEIIARLPRHRSRDKSGVSQPLRASLSADGRLVASASHDGVIRVWDIDAHKMIGEGRAGGAVATMAFDSAGRQFAAGRLDGQIVIFQVSDPK